MNRSLFYVLVVIIIIIIIILNNFISINFVDGKLLHRVLCTRQPALSLAG